MGAQQQRNLDAARRFYDAGPADTDEQRKEMFAEHFVWHVPGDTDLSGPYSDRRLVDMPNRMQPLDEFAIHFDHLAANEDLVICVGRVHGRRLGR